MEGLQDISAWSGAWSEDQTANCELSLMMTCNNGDVLELLKKYMARGRKSGRVTQDDTANHTSDAPGRPLDGGYG